MKLSVKLFRKGRKLRFKLFRNDFDNEIESPPLSQIVTLSSPGQESTWEILRKIPIKIEQSLDFEREPIKKICGEQLKNSTCFWLFFWGSRSQEFKIEYLQVRIQNHFPSCAEKIDYQQLT